LGFSSDAAVNESKLTVREQIGMADLMLVGLRLPALSEMLFQALGSLIF